MFRTYHLRRIWWQYSRFQRFLPSVSFDFYMKWCLDFGFRMSHFVFLGLTYLLIIGDYVGHFVLHHELDEDMFFNLLKVWLLLTFPFQKRKETLELWFSCISRFAQIQGVSRRRLEDREPEKIVIYFDHKKIAKISSKKTSRIRRIF